MTIVLLVGLLPNVSVLLAQTKPAKIDTTRSTKDGRRKLYSRWDDRPTNRYVSPQSKSPLYLKDPKAISNDFKMDTLKRITVFEQLGDKSKKLDFRNPLTMSYQEFRQISEENAQKSLWREYLNKQSGINAKGLLPKLDLPDNFDQLLGKTLSAIKPNGFVLLDVGVMHQFNDRPDIPLQFRSQTNLIFNQQININFNGKISEKFGVNTNFDTKAAFDLERRFKINYKAEEQSIIQGVQAGNVNWKLPTQLISGAENLFGAKADLRFGKVTTSFLFSQQNSKQQCKTIKGGGQNQPFEIRADAYDENKHFFLSQYFRNNYEGSLKNLPMITSGATVTRVEAYVTNRTNNTETLRNLAAFADLGEASPYNKSNSNVAANSGIKPSDPVNNKNNKLFEKLANDQDLRSVDKTTFVVDNNYNLKRGTDYDMLRGARRLTERDFQFHPQLGYLSLTTPLRNDEILAVAYEYTINGRLYKVGELTEDYASRQSDEVLVLKLLKSATIRNNTNSPMWDLMMKNIYSLNTYQLGKKGFQLRIIYKDDLTGIDNPNLQEGNKLQNVPLIKVMGLDKLNAINDPKPDGNFDFVEGATINVQYGRIIFPVLEPFGNTLAKNFDAGEEVLRNKYVFNELYRGTQIDAQQITEKNKFYLKGTFQGSAGGTAIQLPYGVSEESVQVKAGGIQLQKGVDFDVEPQIGQVRIKNESVLNSGRTLEVCYETPDLFQNQVRRVMGTRLEYTANPDMRFGMTAMGMRESPVGYISRTAVGNEPVNNSVFGADLHIRKESAALTKFLDWLPLIQTKEKSSIQFHAEIAQSFAGLNPVVNGRSFIDDFESARTQYDLARQPTRWRLGATPQEFPQGTPSNPLEYGYRRAKISAYTIDNTFYGNLGLNNFPAPANITQEDLQNHYSRYIRPQDIFTGRSVPLVNLPEATFDVAYFPSERGQYNYNTDLNPDGTLKNARQNFGAVTRAIGTDTDFDNANVEYMNFWLLDPFIANDRKAAVKSQNNTKGKLIFQLGDISEDVMKNGRYDFENGLPAKDKKPLDPSSNRETVYQTPWGYSTKQQFVINAFSNETRKEQDIGLDGLDNAEEKKFFATNYLQKLPTNLTTAAKNAIEADPSGDDFEFYFSEEADKANKKIVERYKSFMGMEGSSPESAGSAQALTPASTFLPDGEDLNTDNTINDQEAYYKYEIDFRTDPLEVGKGYVVDKVTANGANWYLFRVPIREFTGKSGDINGFKNMRFVRMVLTEWDEPVVMRFVQLNFTATQYRKYLGDLNAKGLQEVPEPYDAQFTVATVSAEENSAGNTSGTTGGDKYVYATHPDYQRDRDITQLNNVVFNEQSMSLCVTNLRNGDSRGAFKNVNLNLINRQRLRMLLHMHNDEKENGQVSAFLRLGTDVTENYYEIEVRKLKATQPNNTDPLAIWPIENEIDVAFSDLIDTKVERDRKLNHLASAPYTIVKIDDMGREYRITVVGRPDLSAIMVIMLGVRNPRLQGDGDRAKSFCIWVDELHSLGLDNISGTSGLVSADVKLADLGTIQAAYKGTSNGFGNLNQKVADRERVTTQELNLSVAFAIDKLLPERWGWKIPLYMVMDKRKMTPHFNPFDPDMPLQKALESYDINDPRRLELENVAIENEDRKGFNFSNVRKTKVGDNANNKHFWDFENFAFTYAFNESVMRNSFMADFTQRQNKGGIIYQYGFTPKNWEPFKNVKSLDRPYLSLIKNINLSLLPNMVAVRLDANRSFVRSLYRSADLTTAGQTPLYEKIFMLNRNYDLSWNLTKSVVLTYRGIASASVDEPYGEPDIKVNQDTVWRNFKRLGRMKNFDQEIRATYRIPFEDFPLLDWMTGDYSHAIKYQYQANALGISDSLGTPFGNVVQNSRDRGIRGRVDFVKLYNKIKYLNFANRPSAVRKNFARSPGDDEDIVREPSKALKNITRFLMAVRGIDVDYNIVETTTLPGFLPSSPRYFGLDAINAPGLPFILGNQDPTIVTRAAANGWITPSTILNNPFMQTRRKTFRTSTNIEPFKDFRVRLEARLTRGDEYRQFYRPEVPGGPFTVQSPIRNGNFEMTFMSFKTAFAKINKDNSSPVFEQFKANREVVLARLNKDLPTRQGYTEGKYNLNSQDVLIASFFAAYNGKDPETVRTNPFLGFPLPNWRIDYGGLAQLEPFKKIFSSFTFEHSYTSVYSVGNFTSNLEYGAMYVNLAVKNYPMAVFRNIDNNQLMPVFAMSTITLSEKFAPLIGIRARTQSKIDINLNYGRSRDVALNLSNSQVAELYDKNITASLGFTKNNVRIPFPINGEYKRLKNDLVVTGTITVRDTRAIQRRFDEEAVPISGSINEQYRLQADYTVSKLWSIQFYFDYMHNNPLVSNNFRRLSTTGGFRVKFNVAEL